MFAWPSRENVLPFLLNANSAGPRKKGDLLAFCLSDMRKIKFNLVIFVTDNFLLLSIVGNTIFLRAGGKNGGAAHRNRGGQP